MTLMHPAERGGPGQPSRRSVLAAAAAFGASAAVGASALAAHAAAPTPAIHPRADWAGSLRPTGPMESEAPGDVKFLLVHHTESANGYSADRVPSILRGMYEFHTGPKKQWPDLAYNFLIDAHGGIWEGRAGSLAGPVKGSATGGSQGFAQLCCFIGSHTDTPPTAPAQAAMISLLAWLAQRYTIDLRSGRTITFTSRGSSKWPAGRAVTTDPVAGHRDMSDTTCPGDACYPLVRGALLGGAIALLPAAAPAPTPPATQPPATATPTQPPATATPTQPPTTTAAPTDTAGEPASARSSRVSATTVPAAGMSSDGPSTTVIAAGVGAAAAVGAGAVAAVISGRRAGDTSHEPAPEDSRLDG